MVTQTASAKDQKQIVFSSKDQVDWPVSDYQEYCFHNFNRSDLFRGFPIFSIILYAMVKYSIIRCLREHQNG